MAGTFDARVDELMATVGVGHLAVRVEFDQVYAHRQHEDLTLKHVLGGPKWLEKALFKSFPKYLEVWARQILEDPRRGAAEVGEMLAMDSAIDAPMRKDDIDPALRNSDHLSVLDNGVTVYDRPARKHRLSEPEIEIRNKLLQDPHHWYGRWPPLSGP